MAGIGVDDTRMDLSQFDDASASGRSLPTTPHSPQPDVIVTTGSQRELEQAPLYVEGAESADTQAEATRR